MQGKKIRTNKSQSRVLPSAAAQSSSRDKNKLSKVPSAGIIINNPAKSTEFTIIHPLYPLYPYLFQIRLILMKHVAVHHLHENSNL